MKINKNKIYGIKKRKNFLNILRSKNIIYKYPLKFIYKVNYNKKYINLCICIPKKRIKKAVDRNKLRRRCKECIRLNNNIINNNLNLQIIIIYCSNYIHNFYEIKKSSDYIISNIYNKNIN